MLKSIVLANAVKVIGVGMMMLSVVACVSKQQIRDGASSTMSTIKTGFNASVSGVKSLTSGKLGSTRKANREKAYEIASKYPDSEAPHTILTKPVAEGTLTSGFGFRLNPAGIPIPKGHKGVDYFAPLGTAIYAAESGVITSKYVSKSFGRYVKIEHSNGFSTAYAHMSSFADGMAEGKTVKKGQKIGAVGSSGRSTGPHLHFELHYNGKAIDPFFAKPLS